MPSTGVFIFPPLLFFAPTLLYGADSC